MVVIAATAIVATFQLGERHGVAIIGQIPGGLPRFALPGLAASEFLPLVPLALTISLIGFLENISVAKSLAAKRRQKVDSDQEFIALGAANLAAGVTGGYPVGGSFARSTIALHLWRTSRPHMAVVGRVPGTEHFRNVRRHEVRTLPHVLPLRIDESLYFANAKHIEDFVLSAAADRPGLRHLVLICNAINFIDASALETLNDLRTRIQEAGIELYLTEVKGPVVDRLAGTEFFEQLGSGRVFLTTEQAYEKLASSSKSRK